jgi:hypothetical protein
MNEQLFKLAGKAISEVSVPLDFKHEHFLFATKFAELIVQECMYVGRLSQINNGLVDSDIKEHFGVEEQEKVAPKPKCSVCGTTENVKYMGGHQPYLCDSIDCIPF